MSDSCFGFSRAPAVNVCLVLHVFQHEKPEFFVPSSSPGSRFRIRLVPGREIIKIIENKVGGDMNKFHIGSVR